MFLGDVIKRVMKAKDRPLATDEIRDDIVNSKAFDFGEKKPGRSVHFGLVRQNGGAVQRLPDGRWTMHNRNGVSVQEKPNRGENVDEIKAIVWPYKNGSDAGTGDNQAPKWEGRDPRLRFRARTPTSDFPCLHQLVYQPDRRVPSDEPGYAPLTLSGDTALWHKTLSSRKKILIVSSKIFFKGNPYERKT